MQRLFYRVNATVQILGVVVLSALYILWREELMMADQILVTNALRATVYLLLGWQFLTAMVFYLVPSLTEYHHPLELLVVLAYPTIMLILAFDMGGYFATPVQNLSQMVIGILSGTYFLSSLIEGISSPNRR